MTKKKQSAHTKRVRKLAKRAAPSAATRRKSASDEIERILVEGVLALDQNGRELRHVPSHREIAKRFHIAHSLVAHVAKTKDCAHRHELYREANPRPFEDYEKRQAAREATSEQAELQEAEQSTLKESVETKAVKEALADKQGKYEVRRKPGRPIRADSPAVPWNEVDKALVLGELVVLPNGEQTTVYPTVRELARRYGITHSSIVKYSQDHHCERRRETAETRLIMKTEEKVLDLRSTALAVSKDDVLRTIDKFIMKFEKALDEDRVRYDVPADFNMVVRLKEFVAGGPDSRQENTTTFTLEMLQERHAQVLKARREASPAERGIVDVTGHETAAECVSRSNELSANSAGNEAFDGSNSLVGDLGRDEDTPKSAEKTAFDPSASPSNFTRVESTKSATYGSSFGNMSARAKP